jgi:hypothetical protein
MQKAFWLLKNKQPRQRDWTRSVLVTAPWKLVLIDLLTFWNFLKFFFYFG